jgi:hypothetical protein
MERSDSHIFHISRFRPTGGTRNLASHGENRDTTMRRYNNSNYCWTHGHDIAITHTNQSCLYPSNGRDATKSNTKGGSETG